ncbi:MAG: LPS export ABC transporter permease LptF [Desulfobulbus sp.]|nr:LPS export ABC transporter permease LptF [Desulfobulbus sp.]
MQPSPSSTLQTKVKGARKLDPAGLRWVRPPFLLYSYITNELLAPFFASFLILSCVFFLVRLVPMLDVVLSLRVAPGDFIRLLCYIYPRMLLHIIPMAGLAGVIVGFTRLANDREILALKACGISLKQMLPPVIFIAVIFTCLTGWLSIRLIPAGALGFNQLMFQLVKENINHGLKEKEFTDVFGGLVLYVDKIDDQQHWHGVFVSDVRGRMQPLVTVAKSGWLQIDMERMLVTITLSDGTIHNNEGQDNQVIRFNRYQLQFPLKLPTQIGTENDTSQSRETMSLDQLLAAAAKQAANSQAMKMYLSEYHHRLSLPVGCLILSLIGVALGLQASPGRRAVGIPLGLAIFVLYHITVATADMLSERGIIPTILGGWLANILFSLLAVYVLWRVNKESPLIPAWLHSFYLKFYGYFLLPSGRYVSDLYKRLSRRL